MQQLFHISKLYLQDFFPKEFHNFHANLKKSCKVKKQIYFFMFFVKGFFLHQPVDLVTVVGGDGAFRLQQL